MNRVEEHGVETILISEVDIDSFHTWVEYVAIKDPPIFEPPRPYNKYSMKSSRQARERTARRKRGRSTSPS